jgi:FHA domain
MSATQYAGVTRFRLRFMLQEFELAPGDTLIGRSDECNITLFDPLISRKHARIQVVGNRAVLEDLGSRNGCRVNDAPIQGRHTLVAGDRIRIGKHEFVFGEFISSLPVTRGRPTGSLVFCASCDSPYPDEMGMCPNCGSQQSLDEDTRSGVMNEAGKQVWAIDLMLELFQKAIGAHRSEDAERAMRQAMSALESHLTNGIRIDAARLDPVVTAAIQLSELQDDGFWVRWAADYHERAGVSIPKVLIEANALWDSDDPTTAQQ